MAYHIYKKIYRLGKLILRSLRFFILFITVFIQTVDAKLPKYQLSIVSIFNNEADYLKEWIEFHRLVGVEHFYLYNNNSIDHYQEVLTPYIKQGVVDLFEWPSPLGDNWSHYQRKAYDHCVKHHKNDTLWMAFIDTDEYMTPLKHSTVTEFLEDYKDYGGVYLSWQCYGTSHLPEIPEGKLMIESLTLKYPYDHPKNCWIKTIAQPKKIDKCHIHDCKFKKGHYGVSPSFEKQKPKRPDIEKIRLNHYWTRAEDFFFNVKIPRVEQYSNKKIPQEKIDEILRDSNFMEDLSIFPFIPELRKVMYYDQ